MGLHGLEPQSFNIFSNDSDANCVQGAATRRKVQERLDGIQAFIDFHMKRVCKKDKEIVLARARTERIPPLQGPWAMEERFGNGGWNPYGPVPTLQRSYSMDNTYSSMAYGSPAEYRTLVRETSPVAEHCSGIRGRSPPRGRSTVRRGREQGSRE